MNRTGAALIAASGALLWGTLGPVVQAWSTLGSAETAFARSLVAAVTLTAFARAAVADRRKVREQLQSLALGGIGVAGFQFAYFAAVAESGVAVSTAIGIGLAPAMTGAWSWMTSTRPPATWLAGTGMAVLGLTLLVFGAHSASSTSALGIVWSVLAAAFFSAQVVAIDAIGPNWSHAAALGWMFLIAAIVTAPIGGPGLWRDGSIGTTNGLVIAYVGVVTAGLAYWLFATGTEIVGAAAAATISLLEPVGAVVIAVALLGERQSPAQWLGMTLLVACVAVAARAPESTTGRDHREHLPP